MLKLFFATDVHGSEVCWRKFLNAGAFHKADVLIMGGDMTGKAMVPISIGNGSWRVTLQEQEHVMSSEEEVAATEKRIQDRGYYPIRLTPDEFDAWNADPALVDARFKAEMLGQVERWMALADERLAGKGIRCIVSPANDDIFEIDPIIDAAKLVDLGESNLIDLDGFSLVSTGWANPTPWNTFRELPEPELRARIDSLVADVPDRRRAIFNFHAVRLESGQRPENRSRHALRVRWAGTDPCRLARHPRRDPRIRARPFAAWPYPRGPGSREARSNARRESWEQL
jgi:Icc-related predicted phosphoesterase